MLSSTSQNALAAMTDTVALVDLLIVDDDEELCADLAQYFASRNCRVARAGSGEEALKIAQERPFHVAIIDMVMPGMSGIELLQKLKAENPETEAIFLSGEGTIPAAVEAMKLGACDFLTKPVRLGQLENVVLKAADTSNLRKENTQLRTFIRHSQPSHQMLGDSPAMHEVFRLIDRAGPSDKPILIQGESGTGKELVARALHQASSRADKPLVVINCAALPEPLLESELFGHEKGSFTGAVTSKPGLFEVADGGTLFIDEIGELSPSLQPKLLRVLEDGSLRRIGSLKERRVDVRLLAASNRILADEVENNRFRQDLYYRINIMTIHVPPLREREGDLLKLAEHYCNGWEMSEELRQAIMQYHWPGNVRQLINAIERTKILAEEELLARENLPPEVVGASNGMVAAMYDVNTNLADLTRARVVQALRSTGGNKVRSAKTLGISRRSLYRLIEKYHIEPAELID